MQAAIEIKKKCCVPKCINTAQLTPHKIFFYIPLGKVRKQWSAAMGRQSALFKPLSFRTFRFICEDHFDLEKDTKNYMGWKNLLHRRLMLKNGVLPHKNIPLKDFDNAVETADASTNTDDYRENIRVEQQSVSRVCAESYQLQIDDRLYGYNNEWETYEFEECTNSILGYRVLRVK